MKKNKILAAIALSASLVALPGVLSAGSHMKGYDSSIEYSEYRDEKSTYTLRASDIIGAELENASGESVGEIDDLIVSRKDDKLMAVLSVGGFLDIGDRLMTVPYEDLRMGKEAGKVFWDATKASLEKMPEFTYEDDEVSGYEAMTSRRQVRAGNLDSGERMGYAKAVEYSKFRNEDSSYKLRVSEILGEEIENADGDTIGEVDDLIIPRKGGNLQAVVSVGGFLGIGDRLVTVPYDEMRIAGAGDEFYLSATKEALNSKPVFAYNEGESKGMQLISERKRYVADVKEDLNETKEEAKAELREAKAEAEETVKEAKSEAEETVKEAKAEAKEAVKEAKTEAEEARKEAKAEVEEAEKAVKNEAEKVATTAVGTAAAATARFKDSVGYADVRANESVYHLRMSEIIGEDVKNANDEEVGEIDDLVMSREDDSLMAIISIGGFLGIGDRLVAVPYKDLRVSKDGDDIYIDSTKEKLESTSEFKYNEGELFGKDTLQKRMNPEK